MFVFVGVCFMVGEVAASSKRSQERERNFLKYAQSLSQMNEVRFNWSSSILCDVYLVLYFFPNIGMD